MFMITFFWQASRIIAQFIVMGSGILGRAFFQAYRQAIASEFQHLFYISDIFFQLIVILENTFSLFQLSILNGWLLCFYIYVGIKWLLHESNDDGLLSLIEIFFSVDRFFY